MANNAVHHSSCDPNVRRPSGFTPDNRRILNESNVGNLRFNVECLGCCYAYLTADRQYAKRPTNQLDRVYYIDCIHYNRNDQLPGVRCFVQGNAQIAVQKSNTPGVRPSVRSLANSRTYQTYDAAAELNILGVETLVKTRKECVAIDKVERSELSAVYMNFAEASLVEIYRKKNRLPSLEGFCPKNRSDVDASGVVKEEQEEKPLQVPMATPPADVDVIVSAFGDMGIKTE